MIGLQHASASPTACNLSDYSPPEGWGWLQCGNGEYGDQTDPMGLTLAKNCYNLPHQHYLKWTDVQHTLRGHDLPIGKVRLFIHLLPLHRCCCCCTQVATGAAWLFASRAATGRLPACPFADANTSPQWCAHKQIVVRNIQPLTHHRAAGLRIQLPNTHAVYADYLVKDNGRKGMLGAWASKVALYAFEYDGRTFTPGEHTSKKTVFIGALSRDGDYHRLQGMEAGPPLPKVMIKRHSDLGNNRVRLRICRYHTSPDQCSRL